MFQLVKDTLVLILICGILASFPLCPAVFFILSQAKIMHNCCPLSAILMFFHTTAAALLHVPQRGTIVGFTQDAPAHNRAFDGENSFIRRKEPSSASGVEFKSDVPVIRAALTRCSYHNSFHLSVAGVLTHGGETAFSWVSATQQWRNILQGNQTICGSYPLSGMCSGFIMLQQLLTIGEIVVFDLEHDILSLLQCYRCVETLYEILELQSTPDDMTIEQIGMNNNTYGIINQPGS